MFAGDLQNRRKNLAELLKDQHAEAEVDAAQRPEAAGPDSHAAEDRHKMEIADGNDAANGVE